MRPRDLFLVIDQYISLTHCPGSGTARIIASISHPTLLDSL